MRDHAAPFVLRHAQPNDLPGIAELLLRLSDHSRYLRYFQPLVSSTTHSRAEARRMVLHTTRFGITLVIARPPDTGGEAIAVAELARSPDAFDQAELAMLVRDDYQGQGLGRLLGCQLVALARRLQGLAIASCRSPAGEPGRRCGCSSGLARRTRGPTTLGCCTRCWRSRARPRAEQTQSTYAKGADMNTQIAHNKALIAQLFEAVNRGDFALLDPHPGFHETRQYVPPMHQLFADWRTAHFQQIAEGELVFTYAAIEMTHCGPFAGVAPSGMRVCLELWSFNEVRDGIVLQHNSASSWADVLRQLDMPAFQRWPIKAVGELPDNTGSDLAQRHANKAVVRDLLNALGRGAFGAGVATPA
ncbi:hypothetical protein HC891_08635, partial [Candidatus Gracilibacteria bacterium]|nr:hypothetical protein [Candidatus Gracilibacteria bacterium]